MVPAGISNEKWSVVACDQFSSERDYWERVRNYIGGAPSTLDMIIPEAYLGEINEEKKISEISAVMDERLHRGQLREIENSFIYVERSQSNGLVRCGLIGAIDLERYDFSGNDAEICASENTVLDRLPARIRVRRAARLELPHIIAFIDDKDNTVIGPLSEKAERLPLLYDFDLMEGGGHIMGARVYDAVADDVLTAIRALHEKGGPLMVVGDGNHSLAAAKVYWDDIKRGLSEAGREDHPARRALLEVNNVYDPAVSFEAIHRVVFGADPAEFSRAFIRAMPHGDDYELRLVSRGHNSAVRVSADCIGDMLTMVQAFLDERAEGTGCRIDYIHGTDTAERLAQGDNCLGIILPAMDKAELFGTVAKRGVFPKKSFSVGRARDKRYYLECRVIKS